jgi:hypothetical protein
MVLIPVALLTIFQPGYWFTTMQAREAQRFKKRGEKADLAIASGEESATP